MTDTDDLADLAAETRLNERLTSHPGRTYRPVQGSRWGELVCPAPDERVPEVPGAMRVVLFASFAHGYLALDAVKAYQRRFPGRVQIVGLATDDPANPEARISLKKRIWKYLDGEQQVATEAAMVSAALTAGVPVFTGEVKTDGFRQTLREDWRPDAILSCVLGQVIGPRILAMPPYGVYNFHPSDLLHGHGAGPAPDAEFAEKCARTVWTIHQVSPEIDTGPVVAVSPEIAVHDASGALPANRLLIYDKLVEPVGILAVTLVHALWQRYAQGTTGWMEALDVAPAIPAALQARMLAPITAPHHVDQLPKFDSTLLAALT